MITPNSIMFMYKKNLLSSLPELFIKPYILYWNLNYYNNFDRIRMTKRQKLFLKVLKS